MSKLTHKIARNVPAYVLSVWTALMGLGAVGILGLTDDQIASVDWAFVGRVAAWTALWMLGTGVLAAVTLIVRLGRKEES